MLLHLGTELGSKAYRMYNPNSQKIVVSQDVVFDETKGWNWNQSDSAKTESGNFMITHLNFGNHCITEFKTKESESTVTVRELEDNENIVSREETSEDEQSLENDEEQEELDEITLRRLTRQSNKPKYLEYYVLYISEE